MVEIIKDFIVNVFGTNVFLGIIILSAIPITELRTALPFAMSSVWGANKLSWWQAYICSVVGATIPAFIIIPLLLPLFNLMKKTKWFSKLANSLEKRFSNKSKGIDEKVKNAENIKKSERIKFWGVVAFVAVPLPLTGAWTGSAVSAYLKMHWAKGVLAVFLGNAIAGLIMLGICLLFPNSTTIIMYGFLVLALIVIVVSLILHCIKNRKNAGALEVADTLPESENQK